MKYGYKFYQGVSLHKAAELLIEHSTTRAERNEHFLGQAKHGHPWMRGVHGATPAIPPTVTAKSNSEALSRKWTYLPCAAAVQLASRRTTSIETIRPRPATSFLAHGVGRLGEVDDLRSKHTSQEPLH